jgi:hypothetical protein
MAVFSEVMIVCVFLCHLFPPLLVSGSMKLLLGLHVLCQSSALTELEIPPSYETRALRKA